MSAGAEGPLVLVGGAGAVGAALLDALPAGRQVHVVDRAPARGGGRARLHHEADLAEPASLDALAGALPARFSAVYLAANLGTGRGRAEVAASVSDNVVALGGFLAALAPRLRSLVFVSSISVYGVPRATPIPEDHPLAPTTIYGATKAAGEALCRAFAHGEGFPLAIVRPTQLFGLRTAETTLPHALASGLLAGAPPRIRCDPGILRDYLHVDDLARLLVSVLARPEPGVMNAGSGEGVTIEALFRAAFLAFGRPFDLAALKEPPLAPSFSQLLDTSVARRVHGFAPRVTLAGWFRERAAAARG